jgi:hypothetical protein
VTKDGYTRMWLSDGEVERAARAGLDIHANASEQFARVARPDEREQVGRRIDPSTARVFFLYAQTMDPYGDNPDLPEELQQVGREYFAVDPTEGIAVALHDLPEETRQALADKRRLADREGWRRLLEEAVKCSGSR